MLRTEALQSQREYESVDLLEVGDLEFGAVDEGCSIAKCVVCADEDDLTVLELCEYCGSSVCPACMERHILRCRD